jgi:flagellar hook-length control protein FliK
MTVTNTSVVTVLALPGSSAEVSGGTDGAAVDAAVASNPDAGGSADFWAMVSRNLATILSENGEQAVESKDILAAMEGLSTDAVELPDMVPPSLWIQFLRARLGDTAELDSLDEAVAEIAPQLEGLSVEELKALLASATEQPLPVAGDLQAATKQGEVLPVGRQIDAAAAATPAIAKSISGKPGDSFALPTSEMTASIGTFEAKASDQENAINAKLGAATQQDQVLLRQVGAIGAEVRAPVAQTAEGLIVPLQVTTQLSPGTPTTPAVPAELQSLTLPANASQTQWGQALGERVAFLINHKMNSAEIRIDPPHLGKLDIQIQLKDDSAVVVIQTQHAQTRDMVENSSVRLREFLQQAGYESVDVNVSHRESAAQDQQSGEHYGTSATGDAEDPASAVATERGAMMTVSMSVDEGRIDYFA